MCEDMFSQFVKVLSANEDTFAISKQAFEPVAKRYHIADISYHFEVDDTSFTPGGDASDGNLYHLEGHGVPNDVKAEADYIKEYHTGENGELLIYLINSDKGKPWNEEEIDNLETFLSVFIMHMARYRVTRQAQKNSMSDFMTGLPNADGFMRYAVGLCRKHELKRYNAYYFNLKRFGLVNKRFGHTETDNILMNYARILKKFTNGEEVIGRLGGDNFVALIRKERTHDFLELLSGIEVYGYLAGERIPLTIEAVAGVLEIDEEIQDCSPLISKTGVALNVAKNVAKKPYVFATRELETKMFKQKQIAESFPYAMENEEFVVFYQPKVETDTYVIKGAEALVRWIHDDKVVNPGEFIPVIEQNGGVCQLDFYMLEHVCRDIRGWLEKGIEPVRVSVNFSRKHLDNPRLADDIIDMISKYHVPFEYIEIEVTETMDEIEQGRLSIFMNRMREASIATAIDDFGTGYSSLDILRSFPIDVLKIDKSFIDDEEITESDSIVLSNIIKMAKELNMEVITEGVETWKQVKFLQDMECNLVQGFLFDRPMPEDEFEDKIRMHKYDVSKVNDFS
jgi:diguanylate cyclase (GGDEF)-like protein